MFATDEVLCINLNPVERLRQLLYFFKHFCKINFGGIDKFEVKYSSD
jgi:hypothetical protein